jgi:ABC-2 type transport system ATP-binding protein
VADPPGTEDARPLSLEVSGLTKSFRQGLLGRRRHLVLQGLDLEVRRGEIFGYLGPNGAGKTTTLKAILGLITVDSGRMTVLGRPHSDPSWRDRTGYLPENPYFYDYLTAAEYLDYAGRLHGLSAEVRRRRTCELLQLVGLSRSADLALRRYSKGMVQRVGLAQALISDPDLVFLDEPMSGLDPIGRRLVRQTILDLKKAGKTVLFSTHILSDAEALCDRIALVREGRVVRTGRLDEILQVAVAHVEVLVTGLTPEACARIRTRCRACEALGERHRLEVDEQALGQLLRDLEVAGARILALQPIRQSLEEFFFKEMGALGEGVAGWAQDA